MSVWGPLGEKYAERRPRRLLALDGGGIRGVMTLEILAGLERRLAERTGAGESFRLGDWFDYIAGTSTGAIIAAGLARGMSVDELLEFYVQVGPMMFDKQKLLQRYKSLYKAEPLRDQLQAVFGADTSLRPEHLRCLLLVVTRNASTDSPWPISSNPRAKFNAPERPDCNLAIPLWQLVRASTAAPVYFPPEVLQWDPDDPTHRFVFVDGGITPYNNPAFLLFRMATAPEYRLAWPTGEDRMMLISVGTGAAASEPEKLAEEGSIVNAVATLPSALMYGAQVDQDLNCRFVGRCVQGDPIDGEVGDMVPDAPLEQDLGRAFLYARYNADLSRGGLDALGLPEVDPAHVSKLDSVQYLDELRRVGQAVARGIRIEPFERFL